MPLDLLPSTCPHDCPSTCALDVERLSADRIGRIHGARANPYTDGIICAKVARYAEREHHEARLRQPLRRIGPKGAGLSAFRPIGWGEALDEIAHRFQRIAKAHGPEAIWPYYYAGTMGLVQRDSIHRLRHEMRYSRQKDTICVALSDAGWLAGIGALRGLDPREMMEADLIVIWGGNPVATQINVMHWIAKARKARGAKLAVIDPYRTATAEKADFHLMPRPGTDGALAAAMLHVLFAENLVDRDYLARYTDCDSDLERHLETRDPEWASAITGIAADDIRDFARLYGRTKRSFIRLGYGFTRSRNGAAAMHAVTCLPAATGAWRVPGGGALYSNRALYPLDAGLIQGLADKDEKVRALDQSRLGDILAQAPDALGKGPPVLAMLVQNTNPMMVCPDSLAVGRGLARDDLFLVVHEQFMTETAAMADIVLPATTFLEHDDMYRASGHTFFQVARAIVSPPGEAKSNHEVINELGKRLGCRSPAFSMSAWELIEAALKATHWPAADRILEARGLDCSLPFARAHFLDGFGHEDRRFHFRPDWRGLGDEAGIMPAFPDHQDVIDKAGPDRPFRLVTAPARNFLNSTFSETPTSRAKEEKPRLLIHPEDAAALELAEGDIAEIGHDRARIHIHVRPFAGLQRGVLIIESLWPNAAFIGGIGVNALTSAAPGHPNGGAVFHDTAVFVRKRVA